MTTIMDRLTGRAGLLEIITHLEERVAYLKAELSSTDAALGRSMANGIRLSEDVRQLERITDGISSDTLSALSAELILAEQAHPQGADLLALMKQLGQAADAAIRGDEADMHHQLEQTMCVAARMHMGKVYKPQATEVIGLDVDLSGLAPELVEALGAFVGHMAQRLRDNAHREDNRPWSRLDAEICLNAAWACIEDIEPQDDITDCADAANWLLFAYADLMRAATETRTCRVCGCTDDRACPGGCHWVGQDLCSACAADAAHKNVQATGNDEHSEDVTRFEEVAH